MYYSSPSPNAVGADFAYPGTFAEPPASVTRACPEPAGTARDRCTAGPVPCPAIPSLLCVTRVSGRSFTYVHATGRNAATGLIEPTRVQENRLQKMIPPALRAVEQFLTNMALFFMPVDSIYTAGSLYCRCISNTARLSNHSFGDAIDVVGIRWPEPNPVRSRTRHTLVHNFADPEQRRLLRRINACLRLSFPTVIDYHRADHRDHFHCDMAQGRARAARGRATVVFVQEALGAVLGRAVPVNGRLDAPTQAALREYLGIAAGARLPADLNPSYDRLFRQIAATP